MDSSTNSKKIMGGLLALVMVIPAMAFALSVSVTVGDIGSDNDVASPDCTEKGKEQKGKYNFNKQDCDVVDVA